MEPIPAGRPGKLYAAGDDERRGTYTELLTCLEMKRDARKLPNELTTGAMTR
jgi:hypothetical protein